MLRHVGTRYMLILFLLNGVRPQVVKFWTIEQHTSKYVYYTGQYKTRESFIDEKNLATNSENTSDRKQVSKECNHGYVKKDKRLAPSSENCVPRCKKECANGQCSPQNECLCFEGYEKHSTKNTCIRKSEPLTSCNEVSSSETTSAEGPFEILFYLSVVVNAILLAVIGMVLLKRIYIKRNAIARYNPTVVPACSAQYLPMSGDKIHLSVETLRNQPTGTSAGAREAPCYDYAYIQTPLPIHPKEARQGVWR